MRNNPTEPEKRLWRQLSNGQLEGYKFRRQQVIGHYIADFVCPAAKLIVEVDGNTHTDPGADARRTEALAILGYRVVRFANSEVLANIEGVLTQLAALLNDLTPAPFRGRAGGSASSQAKHQGDKPHPNPVSGRSGSQPDLNRAGRGSPDTPEGEGLEKPNTRYTPTETT